MDYILLENMEDDGKLSKYISDNYKNIKLNIINGKIELIEKTNIKKITPIIYELKLPKSKYVILYFKCEEILSNKFYCLKTKREYNFVEIKGLIKELSLNC